MSIFSFLGDIVGSVASGISNVIDSINAPDSEKQKLKSLVNSQMNDLRNKVIDSQVQLEKEITERQKNDMTSDSWLSKNIRPLTLVFILTMFVLSSFPTIWNLKIDQSFIEMLRNWGQLVFMFYFGGRSAEKIFKVVQNIKSNKNDNND